MGSSGDSDAASTSDSRPDPAADVRRWRSAFEHSPIGAALLGDDGAFLEVNATLAAMLAHDVGELRRLSIADVVDTLDRPLSSAWNELLSMPAGELVFDARLRQPDGPALEARLHIAVARAGGKHPRLIICQVADVTARLRAQRRFQRQSLRYGAHDPLTDLPNRPAVEAELGRYLARRRPAFVVCCDVDRFRTVNDTLGHEAGDAVLLGVAARLRTSLPSTFMLGRIGGDEFVAISPCAAGDDLQRLGEQVLRAFDDPLPIRDRLHTMSVSVGLTATDLSHRHPNEVLRAASLALYRAKRLGRGRAEVYDPAQDQPTTLQELELEDDLRTALGRDDSLIPHFQPIVGLQDGLVAGYETLARWRHPTRGLLDPAAFVPLAERTGLIVGLGWRMLDAACAAAARPDGATPWLAVNVSGAQLGRGRLVEQVRASLARHALPAERLHLEITETTLVDASDSAVREVREVAALGARIALDDFGTGYSSLTLLRDLPVSAVKIDRSFVTSLASQRRSQAIVRSLIGLCRELDIITIAEGIETQAQLASLGALGCDYAQGYLTGRPAPL